MKKILDIKGFSRIMGHMKPRMAAYIAGMVLTGIFSSSSNLIMAYVLKDLVDAAADRNILFLYSALILLAVNVVMLCIGYPVFEYIYKGSIRKTTADIRLKLFSHLEEVKYSHIESMHSGEVISRMSNDMELLEKSYADDLRNIFEVIISGIASMILMFTLDWAVSLMLLAFGVITLFVNRFFAIPLRNISTRIQEKTAVVISILTDMFSGFQTVKSLNLKKLILSKFETDNSSLTKDNIKKAGISALLDGTNYLLEWINFGGCVVIGAVLVMSGRTTFGILIAIVQLLNYVIRMFSQLGSFISQLQTSLAGADRVFELMDKEKEPERYSLQKTDERIRQAGEIVFDNVSYTYDNGTKALDNISFSISRGSSAALVGASGSGKSTIMKILLGLYCPESGGIAVSGRDMEEYSLDSLRDMMSYVSQDCYLFNVSIKENIRYGRPNATDDEIIEAAKMAFAHDFISEQPNGYDTIVGERGHSLSGGQKQRIAIARAFLKNAPILLLDEATSSLDSISEDLVKEALIKLMKGRTTLTIAHRTSTIDNADVVFEVDQGKLFHSTPLASFQSTSRL